MAGAQIQDSAGALRAGGSPAGDPAAGGQARGMAAGDNAGLYLHVPYCRRICPYCDFNVIRRSQPPWPRFGAALQAELMARAPLLGNPLRSVYFGGGTPSLAPVAWLLAQLAAVRATLGLLPDAEVTLELEPGTLDAPALAKLRAGGFNRISMGWQSTHDALLTTLGRGHDARTAQASLQAARAAGFAAISLDLMFAVPGQTLQQLAQDLARVLATQVPHLSLYHLTYHAGTPFARALDRKLLVPCPEELELAMLETAAGTLRAAGFERYEVSNFARPGYRAVHNAGYWQGRPYLGLGPGAHSFVPTGEHGARAMRWENVRAPAAYLQCWAPTGGGAVGARAHAGPLPRADDGTVQFAEQLGAAERVLEHMLLGLRCADGIDLAAPLLRPFAGKIGRGVATLTQRGWASQQGDRLLPTALGLCHADAAALLFA